MADYYSGHCATEEKNSSGSRSLFNIAQENIPGCFPSPVRNLWTEHSKSKSVDMHVFRKIPAFNGPGVRVNLGFNDASSLESIFDQLGLNPNVKGAVNGIELATPSGRKKSRSSEPRVVKVSRKSFDTLDVESVSRHDRFMKVSPELLAQQISLIEFKHFQAIRPEEFTSLKWNSKEKLKYAPNIVASTRWFNQLIFWVQKHILNESIQSKRTEILSHFIRVAKKLVDLNNFCSAMAIVSGLQVQCVHRLSATWAGLSSRDRGAFRKMTELFSPDQNYTNLRSAVDAARLPCIPYLGLYLSDLTFIDVASTTLSPQETNNTWNQRGREDRINKILTTIARFQRSAYPFSRNEKIATYLEAQRYIEELQRFIEDANYKLSLRLEPPSSQEFSQSTGTTFSFPPKPDLSNVVLRPVPVLQWSKSTTSCGSLGRRHDLPSQIAHGSRSGQMTKSATSSPRPSNTSQISTDLFSPPLLQPPVKHLNASSHRKSHGAATLLDSEPTTRDTSLHAYRVRSGPPGHRRLGSWTGVDSTEPVHNGIASTTGIRQYSNSVRSCDPVTPNSPWSTSSGSTERSRTGRANNPLPLQPPLSSLFDQSDANSTPNALSSNSRAYCVRKTSKKAQHKSMVSLYPHFSLESPAEDSHVSGSHNPTTILEHCAGPRGLNASHSFILSDRGSNVNGSLHSPQRIPSPTAQLHKHTSRPRHMDARSVHSSAVDHKGQYKIHLAQSSRCSLFDESVPANFSTIRRSVTPTIRVTEASSTLNDSSDSNSICSDKNLPLYNTIRSSSPVLLSHKHSGSSDCTLSHLALAALATVQLHVGHELARLSSNEQASSPLHSPSLQRTSRFPSRAPSSDAPFTSPLSPARALCLDLHFSSGLHAIREGHLLCARSTVSEFNRAVNDMSHSPNGQMDCPYFSFGSFDELLSADKEHRNTMNLRASPASARNKGSQNLLPGPPKRTTSMSALLSQLSLASRALTVPMPSSSSTSSASPGSSCVTRSSAVIPMVSPWSPTTPCNSDHLWPLWRLHSPRFKLYWAVLIVSDASVAMPEALKTKTFLVLFKPNRRQLPPSIHICEDVSGSGGTVGHSEKRCTILGSCPSKQCLCTPHSFSPRRCKVLQVNAVVSNTAPTDKLPPSVIILDSSIPNQKVYRLSHLSSQHESTQAYKSSTLQKRRSLGVHRNATPVKSQRTDILQALRRMWPSRWTPLKLIKYGRRSPRRTESQCDQLSENPGRLDSHCFTNHLASWLSLLSLFPDPMVQQFPHTKRNDALLSVGNTENLIANADELTS